MRTRAFCSTWYYSKRWKIHLFCCKRIPYIHLPIPILVPMFYFSVKIFIGFSAVFSIFRLSAGSFSEIFIYYYPNVLVLNSKSKFIPLCSQLLAIRIIVILLWFSFNLIIGILTSTAVKIAGFRSWLRWTKVHFCIMPRNQAWGIEHYIRHS